MPANRITLRARIRDDLDDATSIIWTDAKLNRHLDHALRDLQHKLPRQRKTTLATVNNSRDLDISTLTPRISIVAVEYKTGQFPPRYVSHSIWIDTLTILDDPIPDGSNAAVYWHSPHTLDDTTSTLNEDDEDILLLGAEGYACRQQHADTVNVLNTGGPAAVRDWAALAADLLAQFRAALRSRGTVHVRRLYAPDQPAARQDTDPGP